MPCRLDLKLLCCCVALLTLASPDAAAVRQETWQAGVSLYTESGDYGTGSRTSTTYIPFSLKRFFNAGEIEGVLPILSVSTEGDVVLVSGVPNRPGRGGGSAARTRQSHGGLGDILLKGRAYLLEEGEYGPSVDATAKIKFPTARRSDNLGTGEFDEGLGLEFARTLRERIFALADVGYTFIGNPPGQDFRDQWNYSVGGGYSFVPMKWSGTLTYEERRALVEGDSNPKDLFLATGYRFTPQLQLDAGFLIGLSRTAADYGIQLGGRVKF